MKKSKIIKRLRRIQGEVDELLTKLEIGQITPKAGGRTPPPKKVEK